MVENAKTIWADGPSGSPMQPDKAQIRAWGTWIESFVTSIGQNAGAVFQSRSELYGNLTYAANTMAWVLGDTTNAYNGIYRKIGDSGTGSWLRVADLPYPFIVAANVGAGTANAIIATTDIPISETSLIWLPIYATNTTTTPTVAFNGDAALSIKTNSGNDPASGGLIAGMIVLGKKQGSQFRLISDQVASAVLAAAEAAAAEAADYASLALNNRYVDPFAGDGSTTAFTLSYNPGSKFNTTVNVDGVLQLQSSYSVVGTALTFTQAPPGDGATHNIEVAYGGRVDTGTPGSETITDTMIATSSVAAIRTKLSTYSKSEVDTAIAATSAFIPAGHLFGLVASNNASDSNNDIDFAAGEASSSGASPVLMNLASAITKRSDAVWAVGTGNGAMDTGTKPTSGWLHWYLMKRPDTGVVDVCCSASASAPTTGGNIPSAYTKYRRILSTRTDSSGNILAFSADGDEFLWKTIVPENSGSAISTSTTAALVTLAAIPTGVKVDALLNVTFTSATDVVPALLSSPDELDIAPGIGASNAGGNVSNMQNGGEYSSAQLRLRTNTSAQLRHRAGASGSLYIFTRGFVDKRGRLS